jgi:hypothetical protein
MPDPTGRWLNTTQWQCPKCAWVNGFATESCEKCDQSVRPPENEPVRPLDPLDLIGHDPTREGESRVVELVHTLTRVTREKAMALIGDGLRSGLKKRGERADRVLQAISELPEEDQHAALGSLVDDLEKVGFALYRIDDDEPG